LASRPMNTKAGSRSAARSLLLLGLTVLSCFLGRAADLIPLPEHPRPDFERAAWLNLNGAWQFRFDKADAGMSSHWAQGQTDFPLRINVPFPWGSPLSIVKDEAPIAWYARSVRIPEEWRGQRVFVVVG